MARISLSPRVTRLGDPFLLWRLTNAPCPREFHLTLKNATTHTIHSPKIAWASFCVHEHLSVWRSFRTLVGAFFWHYLVITMRWFHCGFHFSKFIQPSAPTRALLPPVTVTNKQQSEIPIFPMQCHEADVLHRCMGCAWCWWHRSQRSWSQWRQGCQRRGGLRSQRRCRHLCSQHWTLEDFRIWLH